MKIRKRLFIIVLTGIAAALSGCGTATVTSSRAVGIQPKAKPAIIYVADFDLDVAVVKSDPGALSKLPKMPGPLGNISMPLPGATKDPQKLARNLVNSMSAALVKDLNKAGVTSSRLMYTNALPTEGWLVRGMFMEVNQGNQLRRAMIGCGVGKTELEVVVVFNDLTQGPPKPFYEVKTAADSGKTPGAAPMIVLGPAGAAARFVLAGKDLDKNLKQTASRIVAEILQHTKQPSQGFQTNL